jgi:ABC-type multidrug transport system ATPase subunit
VRDRTAIAAEGLSKRFGRVRALESVDLEVKGGTVLALLGPNGAGKTTTVRILTALLRPDAGRAWVERFRIRSERATRGRRVDVRWRCRQRFGAQISDSVPRS